jgi:hypothetical protein
MGMDRYTIERELALKYVVANLTDEFAGIFSRETIERYIVDTSEYFKESRVAHFVPLLVERFTRERLRAGRGARSAGKERARGPVCLRSQRGTLADGGRIDACVEQRRGACALCGH